MTECIQNENVKLYTGDCRKVLKELPAKSVHCCITSPPYFGLRDYGIDAQIGREKTPNDYVHELVIVFREVKRVMRDDGTLWLNIGDSYSGQGGYGGGSTSKVSYTQKGNIQSRADTRGIKGIKTKELLGIPWRVAFALQKDGWYLRQDIIWNKPSAMPESVTDRCTKSHEYIFLFSKKPKYYFDQFAIREPAITAGNIRSDKKEAYRPLNGSPKNGYVQSAFRNKRSVWTIPSQPYDGAHFAAFPPALITPMILAGSPIDGVVLDPFGGSGTTGKVANNHKRKAIIIDINPEYVELQKTRTSLRGIKDFI